MRRRDTEGSIGLWLLALCRPFRPLLHAVPLRLGARGGRALAVLLLLAGATFRALGLAAGALATLLMSLKSCCLGLRPCAADPHHLVVMRCLNPAPLHHQLGLAVLLSCGKPLQNIAYVQGLGRVADIMRVWGWVWVMLQRGLVCIIETSFQKASQPMKHCFLGGTEGIEASLIFTHFGAQRCRACRRCWALALQNAVNTVKNCYAARWAVVLSALLLLWLARVLRGPCLLPLVFGPSDAAICGVLLRLRVRAGLRAVLFGLLVLGPLARACAGPHVNLLVWARLGPRKLASPASSGAEVGNMHNCIT